MTIIKENDWNSIMEEYFEAKFTYEHGLCD